MFTVNPAFPHPDQDTDDVQAWPLSEAIAYALKVLKDPKAFKVLVALVLPVLKAHPVL